MRILLALILLAAAVAAGVYFADNPGQVEIAWQGWLIDTSVGVLVAAAALFAFLVSVLALLVTGLRRAPVCRPPLARESRRRAGEAELTRGLVALAAADAGEARRHAERARVLLGETPVVLLLSAEAASRQGDLEAARRAYAALLDRRDTEFLGLRGLIGQALRAGDDAAALPLAERARALRPDAPWLADNLLRLQARAGDWQAARDTLAAAARRRALPAGAERHGRGVVLYELSRSVERAGDLRRASGLAAETQLAPDLAPIAANNARLLLARGRRRAAARAIERAWKTAPHPELARLYLEARGAAEPLAGAASLQRLAARNPDATRKPPRDRRSSARGAAVGRGAAASDAGGGGVAGHPLAPPLSADGAARGKRGRRAASGARMARSGDRRAAGPVLCLRPLRHGGFRMAIGVSGLRRLRYARLAGAGGAGHDRRLSGNRHGAADAAGGRCPRSAGYIGTVRRAAWLRAHNRIISRRRLEPEQPR